MAKKPVHKGKHGGEIMPDGQRRAGGAFAPGNQLAKGKGRSISLGMRMRSAFRNQIGEEKVRKLADEAYALAMSPALEPKERLAAIKLLLEYSVGKPAQEVAVASETDSEGNTRIMFVVKDGDDGKVQEL